MTSAKARSRSRLARSMPRYMVHLPLDVTVLRSGIPDKVPGRSVNLSERGVAVILAAELVNGESVGVELRVPQQAEPLRWRAIVRYQDKLRCGMEFSALSSEEAAAIRLCTAKLKAIPEPEDPNLGAIEVLTQALAQYGSDHENFNGTAGKENWVRAETQRIEETQGAQGAAQKTAGKSEAPGARGSILMLMFLLATCAILLAVFWLRWDRGWEELESGLVSPQRATANENPQLQVPAIEMEKLVIHRVDPDYPPEARRDKLESVVALDVIVGKDGSVRSVRPLNGPTVLARAATDAMRWWKFEPYRVNGAPMVVETTLAIDFKP